MRKYELSTAQARKMGKRKTRVKALTAAVNGAKGGRPRVKKIHPAKAQDPAARKPGDDPSVE